jgi:hypothetical protein
MIKNIAALLLCVTAAAAQTPTTVRLALSPRSSVPRAEIVKAIEERCDGATLVNDAASADYILEATDSGSNAAHHYKLALSDHKRQIFQVDGASQVPSAMTNICGFLHVRK